MAKYKLTVKYNDVCDLSLESDIPDIIGSEFDQYVKSMLYKKEDWENFETNFKEAARLEYGNLSKKTAKNSDAEDAADAAETKNETQEVIENVAPAETENNAKEAKKADVTVLGEVECDISCIDDALDFNENSTVIEKGDEKNITVTVEEQGKSTEDAANTAGEQNSAKETAEGAKKEPAKTSKKEKRAETLSFREYIENKNINTPLDEFVVGACYLDEISDIKEFSLKQLNAKLYPAFGRLANSEVIENAIKRVLIESVKSGSKTMYKINENAWNYHNYDLVKH